MQAKLRAHLGALVALVFGLACATPLEVEPIPLSADPESQLTQLALDLSAARSRDIDLLSPSWFGRSAGAYAEARALRSEGGEVQGILEAVAEGRAALEKAEVSAGVSRETLAEAFMARTRALEAGAARLGEPFEEAESRFRDLAAEIEANDLGDARASRDALAERYRDLELRAIKQRTLGDARSLLARAREEGARERVPEAYEAARKELAEVDAFIERQRYADAAMQRRAEVARFHAGRAFTFNAEVRELEGRSGRDLALEREQRLRRLGERLGLPDRRDEPFASRWAAIESATESLRSDRDFVVAQNEKLRDELGQARNEVAQLSGTNRALARERKLDDLFAEARDHFAPGEADVYRQEGQLIIRLRALDFPVGEATIGPEDYALLAKVQRAIRTFGHPRVTIEGHTDSTGGSALNERLSQERAEAVRDYLVANHVLPIYRIVAVGRGSDEPLAPNETAEGRALNRRIDVILDMRRILFLAAAR